MKYFLVLFLSLLLGAVAAAQQKPLPAYKAEKLEMEYANMQKPVQIRQKGGVPDSCGSYFHFATKVGAVDAEYYSLFESSFGFVPQYRPINYDSAKIVFKDSCSAILRLSNNIYQLQLETDYGTVIYDSLYLQTINDTSYLIIRQSLVSCCVRLDYDFHYILFKIAGDKLLQYNEVITNQPINLKKQVRRLQLSRKYHGIYYL